MPDMSVTLCQGGSSGSLSGDGLRSDDSVVLCEGGAGDDGKITLCEDDDKPEDDDDGFSCAGTIGIFISGNEECQVGEQYIAAGSRGEVAWFISCGEISSAGVILNIDGCCGSAIIIARDQCGQVGMKTVRMPIGQWVREEFNRYSYNPQTGSATVISGSVKEEVSLKAWKISEGAACDYDHDGCPYTIDSAADARFIGLTCGSAYPIDAGDTPGVVCLEIYVYSKYRWRCP